MSEHQDNHDPPRPDHDRVGGNNDDDQPPAEAGGLQPPPLNIGMEDDLESIGEDEAETGLQGADPDSLYDGLNIVPEDIDTHAAHQNWGVILANVHDVHQVSVARINQAGDRFYCNETGNRYAMGLLAMITNQHRHNTLANPEAPPTLKTAIETTVNRELTRLAAAFSRTLAEANPTQKMHKGYFRLLKGFSMDNSRQVNPYLARAAFYYARIRVGRHENRGNFNAFEAAYQAIRLEFGTGLVDSYDRQGGFVTVWALIGVILLRNHLANRNIELFPLPSNAELDAYAPALNVCDKHARTIPQGRGAGEIVIIERRAAVRVKLYVLMAEYFTTEPELFTDQQVELIGINPEEFREHLPPGYLDGVEPAEAVAQGDNEEDQEGEDSDQDTDDDDNDDDDPPDRSTSRRRGPDRPGRASAGRANQQAQVRRRSSGSGNGGSGKKKARTGSRGG